MSKVLFQIKLPCCHGHARGIEDELVKLGGVKTAKVLPNIQRLRVEFDGSRTSAADLAGVLESLGCAFELIKQCEEV